MDKLSLLWLKWDVLDIRENRKRDIIFQRVIAAYFFEEIRKKGLLLSQRTWHQQKGWDGLPSINTACRFGLSSFLLCTPTTLRIGNHHFCRQKPDHTYSQQEFYRVCLSVKWQILPPYITAAVKGKRKESKPLGQAWVESHRLNMTTET